MKPSVKELRAKILEYLSDGRDQTIQRFQTIVSREPQPEEVFACVEFFTQQDYSAAFNKSFCRKQGDEICLETDWGGVSGSDRKFLSEIKRLSQ